MKKVLLVGLTALLLTGCRETTAGEPVQNTSKNTPNISEVIGKSEEIQEDIQKGIAEGLEAAREKSIEAQAVKHVRQ